MPAEQVRALNDLAHRHAVSVSTGGCMEHVLTRGPEALHRYITA
jgi:hypothetical protein